MLTINPNEQAERDNYKLLIGSIIPRPIAFITSQSQDGILNAAPFSYFNIAATEPPMLSVSVQRKNGMRKDTARNIAEMKEFVVHIVDKGNVAEVNKTAANLNSDENELDTTNLDVLASTEVSVPAVKQAKVRFECTLNQIIELGPKEKTTTDFIIGEVKCFHIAKEIYEEGRINKDKLQAISRLAGHDYAEIGETFTMVRPK